MALLEISLSRFGITMDLLDGYKFDLHRRKYISIYRTSEGFDSDQSISVGIPFLRFRMAYPKLTTAGAMLIGGMAKRNLVELNSQETKDFLQCKLIKIEESSTFKCDSKGFVIARCKGIVLGVGFYEHDSEGRWLKGLFPARWRKGKILPFRID